MISLEVVYSRRTVYEALNQISTTTIETAEGWFDFF